MKISYGICVSPDFNETYLKNLLESIEHQDHDDDYEVIIVGGDSRLRDRFGDSIATIMTFDDNQKPGWITRKKNLIAQNAKFENLFICHDYIQLGTKWFEGVKRADATEWFGWHVMLNRVYNLEGTRHADWIIDPAIMEKVINSNPEEYTKMLMDVAPHENHPKYVAGLPYDVDYLNRFQYISGGSFLIKKSKLLEVPFNEDMIWGDAPGEDVEWSRRLIKSGCRIRFNEHSSVMLQKPKKWHMYEMPREFVSALGDLYIKSVMEEARTKVLI